MTVIKIVYTGIGSNSSEIHTEYEFLAIMNREFTYKNWMLDLLRSPSEKPYQLRFKDWILPDEFVRFTLEDWLEYSGAEIIP